MIPVSSISADDPAYLYLNLQPGEQVLMLIRHHWAGFIGTFFIVLGMGLFPILFLILLHSPLAGALNSYHADISALITGYYLLVLTILFGLWVNYYFDIILITNQRIINIAQKGLLSRETSELSLAEIEDVTADVNGVIHTFLNYGLLVIETAGGGTFGDKVKPGYFTISDIPNPNKVARTILELKQTGVISDGGE